MVLFAWKESFSTGIGHIDNQHRQFFYLLNELDMAIGQRREDDLFEPLLRELDRYIRVHFSDEEKLMEGIGYPDLPRHRKEHEFFVSELKSLHERHRSRDARLGPNALLFMTDWFTNHILTEDRKYGEFLFAGRPGARVRMILDALGNGGLYLGLNAGFRKAFGFLSSADLAELPAGRHEIDGDRVFALLSEGPGRKRESGLLEAHSKYIDIQYVAAGTDEMGWKPASACRRPSGPFDPEKDVAFFEDEPDAWVAVRAGSFAIFFPGDAHLPLVSDGVIRKVVVKVAADAG